MAPSHVLVFCLLVPLCTLGAPGSAPAHASTGVHAAPRVLATTVSIPYAARDVSYPQCGMRLPEESNTPFGVLGVNGGRAFTENPCLVEQLRWAKRLAHAPAFYANTGNPGPWRSSQWPLGQTSPMTCSSSNPNSFGCSFDYGWNAARHSFELGARAAQRLHDVSWENARHRAANVDWWLDVEILNSWQTLHNGQTTANAERDTYTLIGAVRALWDEGVANVGIYSTSYQWKAITGGRAVTQDWFATNPVWIAGFNNHQHAYGGCTRPSFTGGPVRLTQYLGLDGFDANAVCA